MNRWSSLLVALSIAAMLTALSACTDGVPSPTPSVTSLPAKASPTLEWTTGEIREPAVAGSFYPEDPEELAAMVDLLLEGVHPVDGEPIGLIVPHAGYVYSGWVAAQAFAQMRSVDYDTVVIIGPNHYDATFEAISVYAEGAFETPLGVVPIDREVAQALIETDERIVFDRQVHAQEHSIEVELPFLQRLDQDVQIVPIVVGQPTAENVAVLAEALAQVLQNRKALVIASSDMSHYPAYDDAVQVDTATLAAVETMDPQVVLSSMAQSMASGVPELHTCLCGQAAVLALLEAAPQLGANQATILGYANSADSPLVEGDRSRVVGYGAVMLWRYEPPDLGSEDRELLLGLARESIEQYLRDGTLPQYVVEEPSLTRKSGAFVTLEKQGELRGCIGHLLAEQPLYATVQQAAISAATEDPRFPALTVDELHEITIEISVLSPFTRVTNVEQIEVGQHGLLVSAEGQRGLLLPQVATDEGWTRDEFLRAVCLKAGLPEDAWEHGAALYTFTAIVFGETP